jgi:urease accessory protein
MLSPAALTLVHWLSPSFPTGAFAYSHGLEQVIADGDVHDPATLHDWLTDVLVHGTGWQDSVLIALALSPGADLDMLDALAKALSPCAERLAESQDMGTAFSRTVNAITGSSAPARLMPLAVAQAARPLGLGAADVAALYLQGFAANLVTMGIKHIPLGQSAGQKVLSDLLPIIADTATRAASATPDDLGNSCLAADLAAFRHETLQPRLYRT